MDYALREKGWLGMGWRILLAVVLVAVPASAQLKQFERLITEFTLANGMHFIVVERHEAPFVTCAIYADVGSSEDPPGKTGLAIMLMHMAFKGTSRIGTKNFALEKKALAEQDQAFAALQAEQARGEQADKARLKALEEAFRKASEAADKLADPDEYSMIVGGAGGVNVNAFIGPDRTLYFYSLPSNKLELWFLLESARFLDPVVRDFYRARDVTREQNRSAQNNPQRRLIRDLLAAAYQVHPYGIPETGRPGDLDKLRRSDAEEFFRNKYAASGMTAVLVGDVSAAEARRWAERYFGRLPKRLRLDPLKLVEPPQENERRVTQRNLPISALLIGYRSVDVRHPDYSALNVLWDLLARDSRSSWLAGALVDDKKVALMVSGVMPGASRSDAGMKYPGVLPLAIVGAPGHTVDELEKALDEQLDRFQKEPLDPDMVAGAKRRSRKAILDKLMSPVELADVLGAWQAITGDWRNLFAMTDAIDKLTPEKLQQIAAQYLQKKNRTLLVIDPRAPGGK